MADWPATVQKNLLPLSVSQTLPEAFREWRYTGEMRDLIEEHGELGQCEMCEHEDVRWHFRIANDRTRRALWTGSVCIARFDVTVHDEDGRVLLTVDAKKKRLASDVRKFVDEAHRKKTLEALQALARREPQLADMVGYYEKRQGLTPKQAGLVLWRAKVNRLEIFPSTFKVKMLRAREKQQIREIEDWKLAQIWPALSPEQQARVRGWRSDCPAPPVVSLTARRSAKGANKEFGSFVGKVEEG